MRKFLLSSFALLMSVAMMAVGAGDGTNKANAIDFDWTSGNIHEAPGALWYCVDLAPINAAAEPALVLYLTNLSDEEAAVDVQISLAGAQRTVSYNIAAEGYYRMDLPIAQFREFITVDQVNLALQSNQKIALSAKVYEFPEYVKEAIANSEPIDWNSGVKQDALSTKWYEVDITSLKTEKQHLQVGFINHEASKKALLTATFVLRGENITLPLVVPAGFSTTKVIDYQLLAKLPVNRIHVGVTTDSPIEVVTSTKSAIATDPTPCLNAIELQHGKEYVHEAGAKQWYKISLDLLKSEADFSSFYLANKGNQRANVTIGMVPDCQYTTGTKITLPIPAGFELGALAPNILDNLIKELQRFETTYNKVDAKDVFLEIVTDQPIHFGLDINNAITNPCLREDLVTFDWETGAKIEAGKATWFDMELDAVRNLGSHINFTFTNHADSIVWVATVVSVDCPAKVTMPLLVPVPARASVDQLVDYSILDAINIDNIYVGVKADGPVELKATAVNAEVIPSAGCESATLLGSGEYTQNPGTKWYQLPMSLFDEVGAAAKLSFKNLTGSTATLSAGVTVGCEYAIAHRAKVKVPKSIDLSVNVPKRILNFARQFVDNDVENFYLQLTTDKAIKFSIDLQAPDVDACRDAVEFDWAAWEKNGLQLEANQDKWYKVNLDYLFNKLENGEDLVVNLVNSSEDMDVNVLATVSPTCPALLSVEKTVDIPAGSDLYKVFTYEEVMKYVGQYDKYIYDGELELLYGQLATYKVYNKIVEVLERYEYAKFIPFGQIDLLLEAYGDHLTVAGLKDLAHNYKKYLSVDQLKEILKTQKEYVSLQDAITLIEKYGDYIPYVDAENILKKYEKYLPYAGGVVALLKKCEKYITDENMKQLYDRCKKYLPIEEMKQLIERLKQYLPENNTCYVNIKTTGELIVKPDDPEPPTPDEPCCPEECEDVPVLDWKMVTLSKVELNTLYKLDITGLYEKKQDININVVNDVHHDTVAIASEIYAHCQDATPVAIHKNNVFANLWMYTVAYDKFAELVDEKQCCMFVKFTAIDTIPVTPDTPDDPCANIPELDWRAGVKLSELQAGWYKMNVAGVHANQESVTANVINDLGCEATVTLAGYAHCEDEDALYNISATVAVGDTSKVVSYDVFQGVVAPHVEVIYVNIESIVTNCEQEPGDDCEHATLLNWRNGVYLSQLSAGWYKLDVKDVHANQESVTAKVINDLTCKATVTAAAYAHCEDEDALSEGSKTFKLGESTKTVSYADFADVVPPHVDVVYVNITSIVEDCEQEPGEDCEHATLLDWRNGVYLSQLSAGWYKLDVKDVHANQESVTAKVINDLTCKATVTAAAYAHCEDEDALSEGSKTFKLGESTKTVSYADFADVVPPHVDVVYVNITSIVEDCEQEPGEDCEHAIALDWSDVKLSQLVEGNWYKLDFSEVHANQLNPTFKATNDLNGDASVSAVAYYHCEDTEAMGNATKKLAQGHVGEREVSYKELTDMIGQAEVLYVQVTDITVAGEDCEHAIALDWSDVKLSQLVEGNWYKLDFSEVHANQLNPTFKATNDLNGDASVSAVAYYHCEDTEAMGNATKKLAQGHVGEREVSYKELTDMIGQAEVLYVQVTDITVAGEDCEHAIALDWSDVKLSQLVEGNWYKLDFSEVHANQLNPTFKATNDLNGDASVSAVAYYHCEDTEAMGNATKKLAQGHVGEREVSYKELTDMIGQAEVLYVQVTDITVAGEDCEHAIALDWSDVKLSQLVEGNWYKLDFSEVHANQLNPTFKATNDLNGDASVSAVAYYHCEDTEAMGNATKKLAQGHVGEREVSYKELTDMIGQAEVLYVQVTDITVAGEDCEHAIALDWSDVKLSQLVEGNWYKLDFSEVHANQLNPTFKATNDLNGDASVSAVAYYHCEDTEAMGNATKKLAQGHVGEREVSYKELTDMIGQAEVLYVQVTDITVTIVDPCADIPEIDWTKGIKLSQLQEGAMYKLNVASVHKGKADVMVSVENDLTCKTRVAASAYYDCQDDETFFEGSYAFELGAKEYVVKYDEFQDYVAEYIEYVYVQVDKIECAEKDTVDVAEFVCDGTEYVDALGEKHIISSLLDPALLTWTAETTDIVYNYVITPIVAPAEMTAELLATIPGAMPVLVAGEKVNVAGTVEAIKNYYDSQDTEAVADVETVVWTAGADATLACEDKSHTMLLTVTSGCEFEWTVELTLDVTPVDVVETTETATICEGETYEWDGKQLSETGSYPMEITNAAGCVVEIKTLELTVTPAETVTLAAVEACDSYEWHGVTYTESGEYTYTENCKTEVLPLTIVKSETVTLAAVEVCDSYEWHGVTYTESGEYTYTENCKTEVLPLTIVKSETVTLAAVEACDSYEWHGVTYTESGEYTYTENCKTEVLPLTIVKSETVTLAAVEACDSYEWHGVTYTESGEYTYTENCKTEVLPLTIVKSETVTLAAVEACDSYEWHGVTYTESGEYTYTENCKTEVLPLTIVKSETVTLDPVVACESYEWHGVTYTESGEYTYTDNCMTEVLKLTINKTEVVEITVTECHAYTWRGETYTVSGDYTYDGDCYKEILHLTIEGQIPENNPELAEAEAVAKYGNRLVMLHLNNFVEKYGWTPAAGDVMWYQVNGDVDTSWEVENDTPLGTGYYIDSQEGYTGEVYAVINASTEDKCQNIYRTKVIALVPAGQAPKLMPTIARPSEDLHLMNLNPSNVTEVRVFNTSGELMATYQAEEASEFVFKAATLPGYYMVEVQHNGEQTTLRYIVK